MGHGNIKRALLLPLVTGCLWASLTGCDVGRTSAEVGYAGKLFMQSQNLGPTLTHSTADHMHTINTVIDRDTRALFDDLDLLYMTERPTRLTRWHDR